jgi:hypothetical protein
VSSVCSAVMMFLSTQAAQHVHGEGVGHRVARLGGGRVRASTSTNSGSDTTMAPRSCAATPRQVLKRDLDGRVRMPSRRRSHGC